MPNIKSAKKRVLVSASKTARNKAAESFMAHFPTMKSIQYKDELEHLKGRVKARVKARLGK